MKVKQVVYKRSDTTKVITRIIIHHLTLASKKSLAPMTPSVETLISDNRAKAIRPLSSCNSPAAALRKIKRNCNREKYKNNFCDVYALDLTILKPVCLQGQTVVLQPCSSQTQACRFLMVINHCKYHCIVKTNTYRLRFG